MYQGELNDIAQAIVSDGKGILAADESTGTITKRLGSIDVESTEENRRRYREILFTTPGVEEYISGVILYDETFHQRAQTPDGEVPFPEYLASRGIIPGIKVDEGTIPLPFFPGEYITEGLDGLGERLARYRELGARFAKWRAVITIGPRRPTLAAIEANAHALARYAALCQQADIVPIVEPEVLMDGDHDIERDEAVTETTLLHVFDKLLEQNVALEGILLKPNMVLPGEDSRQNVTNAGVAEFTVRTFRRVVPAAVPGIVFLSGGQSPEDAAARLDAMNRLGPLPWTPFTSVPASTPSLPWASMSRPWSRHERRPFAPAVAPPPRWAPRSHDPGRRRRRFSGGGDQ